MPLSKYLEFTFSNATSLQERIKFIAGIIAIITIPDVNKQGKFSKIAYTFGYSVIIVFLILQIISIITMKIKENIKKQKKIDEFNIKVNIIKTELGLVLLIDNNNCIHKKDWSHCDKCIDKLDKDLYRRWEFLEVFYNCYNLIKVDSPKISDFNITNIKIFSDGSYRQEHWNNTHVYFSVISYLTIIIIVLIYLSISVFLILNIVNYWK